MDHHTIVLNRTLRHPVEDVFDAWADPVARSTWAPPTPGHMVIYDRADFRVGGVDQSRCGPADSIDIDVEARYLSIVENCRIVFSEVVSRFGEALSASLISTAFAALGQDTSITLTIQLVSFSGEGIVEGHRHGWSIALENLSAHLAVGGAP